MKKPGFLFLIFGVIGILIALSVDATVDSGGYGRFYNIGLLSQKQNLIYLSGLGILIGVILNIFNAKREAIKLGMRACPHCAEEIKKDAKVCRYCHRDVLPLSVDVNSLLEAVDQVAHRKLPRVLWIIIGSSGAVFFLIAGFFLVYSFLEKDRVEREAVDHLKREKSSDLSSRSSSLEVESIVVNLQDVDKGGGNAGRFAQVGLILMCKGFDCDALKVMMPVLRSEVVLLLSKKKSVDLLSSDGKERLIEEIRSIFVRHTAFPDDFKVLIKSLIIQ